MSEIRNEWLTKYFDDRPQLQRPQESTFGIVIPHDWFNVVEKLLTERDALVLKDAEIKQRKKDVRTQYNRAEANLKYAKQLEAAMLNIPPEPAGEYYTGLHCGLEDRDIYDRYEAADYGWESAFEYVLSVVNPLLAGNINP
jgi:hypothetical protein